MKLRNRQFIASAAMLLTLTVTAAAQQGAVIRREEAPAQGREVERSAVNFSGPWRPPGSSGATRVVGTVIDIRQIPVPNARVQLRNLDTGNVEQTVDSSDNGDYAFEVEGSGTYIVEMVMVDGYVVALSNAGSLARYETLNTVVQLPGRWDFASRNMVLPQSMTSYFGMSANTTITAQTLQIAIEQDVKPTAPGISASPF
jgi:hypothetical protein